MELVSNKFYQQITARVNCKCFNVMLEKNRGTHRPNNTCHLQLLSQYMSPNLRPKVKLRSEN